MFDFLLPDADSPPADPRVRLSAAARADRSGLGALARMDQLAERTRASYEQPFALAELTLQAEQTVERMRRHEPGSPVRGGSCSSYRHPASDGTARRRAQAAAPGAARASHPIPGAWTRCVATATAWRAWREETLRIDEAGDQPAAYRRLLEGSGNPVYDLVVQLDQLFRRCTTHRGRDAERHRRRIPAEPAGDHRGAAGARAVGLVVALVIARSITRPLELLRDRIDALAGGRLDTEVPYQQQANELGDIARAVEVFKQSMVGLESERWLKAHTAEIASALQQTDDPSAFGRQLLERLVPLLNGGSAAFYVLDEACSRTHARKRLRPRRWRPPGQRDSPGRRPRRAVCAGASAHHPDRRAGRLLQDHVGPGRGDATDDCRGPDRGAGPRPGRRGDRDLRDLERAAAAAAGRGRPRWRR